MENSENLYFFLRVEKIVESKSKNLVCDHHERTDPGRGACAGTLNHYREIFGSNFFSKDFSKNNIFRKMRIFFERKISTPPRGTPVRTFHVQRRKNHWGGGGFWIFPVSDFS